MAQTDTSGIGRRSSGRTRGAASVEQLVLLMMVTLGGASLLMALGPSIESRHQVLEFVLSLPFP